MNIQFGNIFTRLKNSSFVKNTFIVMSGTALAQAIGFALTPVISRLFTLTDFGIFGSFSSIISVITASITLDYSQAIMLPKDNYDAFHLFFISCFSTLFVVLLCALACLIAPVHLMALMKVSSIWVLVLLVFALLILGLNITIQSWCVRIKAFKQTSASQVIRSLSSNSLQISFGFVQAGYIGLIISSVLADLLASINLMRILLTDFKKSTYKICWQRVKQLVYEYRDFPIYSASRNTINALSTGLPVLLLAHYFGITVAGAYAFTERILSAPMGLILSPLRQVLFQKAAETEHSGGSLLALYIKVTIALFSLIIIPTLLLIIWAPQIFSFVFGQKWFVAGEFASSLIIWLAFYFCNLPSVLFARILRLQRRLFFYDIALLTARVLVLILGGMYMAASRTVFVFSIVGAIMNVFFIVIVGIFLIKKENANTWENIVFPLKED